jgi:ABC-2 type transport system permease protein
MHAAWLIALKDLRLLGRDLVSLFWVVGFPIVFAIFFGSVLKAGAADETAPWLVVVVDEARTEASSAVGRALRESDSLRTEQLPLDEAEARVRRGDAVALVHLTAPREPGAPPSAVQVEIAVDPSRSVEGKLLGGLVGAAVARGSGKAGGSPAAAPPPGEGVAVRTLVASGQKPSTSYEVVFPAAVLWGLMGCAAAFAVSLVTERTQGTLVRLRAAPIAPASILGGKALACFIACAADGLLLWLFAYAALGVRFASPLAVASALLATAWCFVGITVTLSTLGRTEQSVGGAGWATLTVMAMIGGAMVPRYLMPEWLQQVGAVSPVHWGIAALEGATWRGLEPAELAVPCAVLTLVGAAAFGLGLLRLRRA